MNVSGFIAGRLRFKGRIAIVSIAVSYLVMILAVAISSGFRKEIRNAIGSFSGDIQMTPPDMNYISEDSPVDAVPSYYGTLESLTGVDSISAVIYRAGILKQGDNIHGVIFKGIEGRGDLASLGVSIPSRLAEILSIGKGDQVVAYFVGERVKMRKFEVRDIYDSILDTDEAMTVFASLSDMQRLNGWDSTEVSALEISLEDAYRTSVLMSDITSKAGTISLMDSEEDEDALLARSAIDRYPQIFEWLNLIDFNVVFILILMTIVAGFNMISGLLILLFQNISTIGILKSMGMTDRSIGAVFLKASSNLILKGMAIGNALGLLFCAVQGSTRLLKLDPANYFISFVPVKVNIPMILLADVLSYAVIMLLLLLPTMFISKIDPARTVRSQ